RSAPGEEGGRGGDPRSPQRERGASERGGSVTTAVALPNPRSTEFAFRRPRLIRRGRVTMNWYTRARVPTREGEITHHPLRETVTPKRAHVCAESAPILSRQR